MRYKQVCLQKDVSVYLKVSLSSKSNNERPAQKPRVHEANSGNRTRLENQLLIKELSLECLPNRRGY